MRALFMIPKNKPPTLAKKNRWSDAVRSCPRGRASTHAHRGHITCTYPGATTFTIFSLPALTRSRASGPTPRPCCRCAPYTTDAPYGMARLLTPSWWATASVRDGGSGQRAQRDPQPHRPLPARHHDPVGGRRGRGAASCRLTSTRSGTHSLGRVCRGATRKGRTASVPTRTAVGRRPCASGLPPRRCPVLTPAPSRGPAASPKPRRQPRPPALHPRRAAPRHCWQRLMRLRPRLRPPRRARPRRPRLPSLRRPPATRLVPRGSASSVAPQRPRRGRWRRPRPQHSCGPPRSSCSPTPTYARTSSRARTSTGAHASAPHVADAARHALRGRGR
jgi:hypothetical protein